jgi:DNA topoisomerase-1
MRTPNAIAVGEEERDMAKKETQQEDLFEVLRSSGMRKQVARTLSKASGKASAKRSEALKASAKNLREVAAKIDKRAVDPKRSQAAKKAARTRKRNAQKRGTRTRATSK